MSSPRNFRLRQISPPTKSKAPATKPTVTCIAGPIHFSSKAYFRKNPAANKRTKTPTPRNHFRPTATSVEARDFGTDTIGGTGEGTPAGRSNGGNGGGAGSGACTLAAGDDWTNCRRVATSRRRAVSSE